MILQLGTNDLPHLDSLVTASAKEDLVGILYNEHSVQQISDCQTLNSKNDAAFNAHVKALTKYLKVLLTPIPWCFLGGHRSFWNTSQRYFTRDAVHLNKLGHYKYDQSLREGLLKSLHSWACSISFPEAAILLVSDGDQDLWPDGILSPQIADFRLHCAESKVKPKMAERSGPDTFLEGVKYGLEKQIGSWKSKYYTQTETRRDPENNRFDAKMF